MIQRIGFDFGNTIGTIENPPCEKIFRIIKMFVDKYESKNTFIISRAKKQMRVQIMKWLNDNNFFTKTLFDPNNVHFVNEYKEKRDLIINLNINIFVDDHHKIVSSIVDIDTMYCVHWFNDKADINLVPKKYRKKISITTNWGKIWSAPWNKDKKVKF
jgi:hypothetical protein